jgi:hypothetical protein
VDLPLLAEKVQVAVDGPQADVGEDLPGFPVDQVGGGVGRIALPEDVQDDGALAGISRFFQSPPPFLSVRKVSYFPGIVLSRKLYRGGFSYI